MDYAIVKLKNAVKSSVRRDNILSIHPLYSKEDIPALEKTFRDRKLLQELSEYFSYKRQKFTQASLQALAKLSIR